MSNLIKSSFYLPQEHIKTIEAAKLNRQSVKLAESTDEDSDLAQSELMLELDKTEQITRQMILDAEQAAEQLIIQSKLQAEQLLNEARIEIDNWWNERRQQDQEAAEQARQAGFQAGFADGERTAELHVNDRYNGMIVEGQTVLEQAYELHRQTIIEAEPFLLEMSCAIAEKIILKKLDDSTDWITDMVKHSLKRCSEKGVIALCVAPAQFAYIQSVREELSYAIDAQAELHIYPDATVKDHGCVIKTPFGSIDARVETQLTEIKHALLDIARRGDGSVDE